MRFIGRHTRYRYADGAIWDHGEIAGQAPVVISQIDARWRCARYRHFGIEAQEAAPQVAEYARARMIELHDALAALLHDTRRAA